MMKHFATLLLSICIIASAATPLVAFAQTVAPCGTNCNLPYVALEPIPGLTTGPNLTNPNSLPSIVNAIFKILITVGALFAVLMLTIGGIQYMVSGGPVEKNKGIKRAQAALWGIVLIAASWLILNTINPKLLSFNLNPCPSGVDGINCGVKSAAPTPTTPPTYEQAITNVEKDRNTATAEEKQVVAQEIQKESSACTGEIQDLPTTGPGGCQNQLIQDMIAGTSKACTPIANGITGKYCIQ